MKHERVTGELQEAAALYALGSLSQNEARGFENHLKAGCAVCENELAQFQNVVGTLGLTAVEVEPPAYLRELVAAHIEQRSIGTAPSAVSEQGKKKVERPIFSAAGRPEPRPGIRWLRFAPWILAVACAIAAGGFYSASKKAQQALQLRADEVTAARDEADRMGRELEAERVRSKELEQIGAFLAKPGARVILLTGAEPSLKASAAILWDTSERRWLVTGNLPPAAEGKRYQLWYVTPTGRYSAGMLDHDPAGRVFKVMDVWDTTENLTEVVITLEPAAGSAQPTWPIVARGAR
ncbi:MAG: anti-sigma factor [Acidobacteria bacterium]|nr:anti-sigma factor [Acidobacteriota bacterium]